jgi:hypothetical protein
MMESVIGLLRSHDIATRVQTALIESGCAREAVEIFAAEAREGLAEVLEDRGLTPERARQYVEAVVAGGVLVVAEAATSDAALAVMNRFDLVTPQALLQHRAETVETARTVEERLEVGKQEVTGGKRLVTQVTERAVEKPVTLREEEVEQAALAFERWRGVRPPPSRLRLPTSAYGRCAPVRSQYGAMGDLVERCSGGSARARLRGSRELIERKTVEVGRIKRIRCGGAAAARRGDRGGRGWPRQPRTALARTCSRRRAPQSAARGRRCPT